MKIDPDKFYLACADRDMSENEAMKKAGVAPDLLARIRKGRRVQASTLAKLAKALDVRPKDLVVLE